MTKKIKWKILFTFKGEADVFAETLEEAQDIVRENVLVDILEDFWDYPADYEVDGPMIDLISEVYNDDGTVVELDEEDDDEEDDDEEDDDEEDDDEEDDDDSLGV